MVRPVLGTQETPCKIELVDRAKDQQADIKDQIAGLDVEIYRLLLMPIACLILIRATAPSCKNYLVKVKGKQLRLILRVEERFACRP